MREVCNPLGSAGNVRLK
jgi:hypothetical protein